MSVDNGECCRICSIFHIKTRPTKQYRCCSDMFSLYDNTNEIIQIQNDKHRNIRV